MRKKNLRTSAMPNNKKTQSHFDLPPALDLVASDSADAPVDPDLSSFQALLNGEFEDDELQVLSSGVGLPRSTPQLRLVPLPQ
jgi:hypothetical protein